MKVPFNDLSRTVQPELQQAVARVVESGWYLNGKEIQKFESSFATFNGVEDIVTCSSGTDALELALRAWNVGPGDEVIVPANTWVSDAEVVHRVGADIVFVDVDIHSGMINLEDLASKRSDNTRVLVAVHLYGNHQIIKPLRIVMGAEVKILEDFAHRVGTPVMQRGSDIHGDAVAFSFYPTKNLGAMGDAGAICGFDSTFTEKVRLLRDHGQVTRDQHEAIGATNRMDEIQAAVLSEKLKELPVAIKRRSQIAAMYMKALEETSGIRAGCPWQSDSAFHLFVVLAENRDHFLKYLDDHGVGYGFHYPHALSDLAIFQPAAHCRAASQRAAQLVSLPLFPELTDEEVDFICGVVKRYAGTKETS